MRPTALEEFVGQSHLLGEGSALRQAIEEARPHSMVLYGPPGSGKTTLARIVAAQSHAAFEEASAVNAGKAEVTAVIERAVHRRQTTGEGTIFFLDEIHRFNKAQQDALLPAVEEGLVTLIGATTENPYFEVNSALLSRAQIYELQPLEAADIRRLLDSALSDPERGLADPPEVSDEALARGRAAGRLPERRAAPAAGARPPPAAPEAARVSGGDRARRAPRPGAGPPPPPAVPARRPLLRRAQARPGRGLHLSARRAG